MDTLRAVSVYQNVSTPVTPYDESLSKLEYFPSPYDKMSSDVVSTLSVSMSDQSYNANNKIMEFVGYQKKKSNSHESDN